MKIAFIRKQKKMAASFKNALAAMEKLNIVSSLKHL
jgi:hypothetical protein